MLSCCYQDLAGDLAAAPGDSGDRTEVALSGVRREGSCLQSFVSLVSAQGLSHGTYQPFPCHAALALPVSEGLDGWG